MSRCLLQHGSRVAHARPSDSVCVSIGRQDLTTEDEQHRLILEAAENAMLIVDADGKIVFANSAAERSFGYPPGGLRCQRTEILGCAEICAAVTTLREPSVYVDPLGLSAFSRGGTTACRADGTTLPVEIGSRTLNGHDRPRLLISIRAPIQRRRTDERPELGKRAMDATGAGPANAGPGRVGRWRYQTSGELWWSEEVYQIFGLPASEPPTIAAAPAAYEPGDRARVSELATLAMRDGTAYRDEARIVRPDGSIRSVFHSGSAERSPAGEIIAIAGFFQDLTDIKNADLERERLSEYVTLANQAGKVGIWELDLVTNISSWDRNMYAIYGIGDSTTVPTFEMWSAALHPHDREHAAREIKTDIAGGALAESAATSLS